MPSAFRFVHVADVHLDTPYGTRSESLRRRLTESGRHAFSAAVDLCLAEDAHALLIAGDLFDNERLRFATEGFLTRELARLTDAGRAVVVVTGNHDPGRATGGNRAHAIAWPAERCHLLRSHVPEEIVVHDAAGDVVGRVIGAGHQTSKDTLNLAERYPEPSGPEPAVGLLHTQVQGSAGSEQHLPYAPCTPEDLAGKPFRYWALGHVHKRQQVLALPEAWYPGNLQGRSFRETGAKGALLVTVPAQGPAQVAFRPLAPVRFEWIELSGLDDVLNLSDLLTRARARFERIAAAADVLPDQEWLLRIELSGPCPLAPVLRAEDSEAEVAAEIASWPGVIHAELRAARVTPPVDLSEHRGQPHVLGLALELLDELREDDDLLDHVAPEVLAGFKGDLEDEAQVFAYLREMLTGLSGDVAEALLLEARA